MTIVPIAMGGRPDEVRAPEDWLTEVEREICRLPDVSIARLVGEDDGRVTEVHIVANAGKHPKQIVRDVQSVAVATLPSAVCTV